MKYIDREQAIRTLKKIQEKRKNCNCGRSSIYEAQALGYAIAVITQLPTVEINEGNVLRNNKVETQTGKDT